MLNSIKLEELMPLEIDDEFIQENGILLSPPGLPCLTTGFNINSRVFWAAILPSVPGNGVDRRYRGLEDYSANLEYLKDRFHNLKYMLDDTPSSFRQYASTPKEGNSRGRDLLESQITTLRANVHVTHLWLQSVIMDRIDAIVHNSPESSSDTPNAKDSWREREDICRQLLHILHSIPVANHEPNGCYLIHKVRDCAATLLTCPSQPEEESGRRAAQYLTDFTSFLAKLDNEFMSTVSLQSWVDTDRQYMHV
jgi:hypothetical protein